MTTKAPERWLRVDGSVVSCKEAFRAEFRRLIDGLDCDYKELLQPVEAKGVKGD